MDIIRQQCLMGGVSKISDQFSLMASMIALGGAIFLIIKTMLGNLVARSSEIGILKAVGWTERDVQKQLMGEALVQSLMGCVAGIVIGYGLSYLLGLLSIPLGNKPCPRFCQGGWSGRGPATGKYIRRVNRNGFAAILGRRGTGKLFYGKAYSAG